MFFWTHVSELCNVLKSVIFLTEFSKLWCTLNLWAMKAEAPRGGRFYCDVQGFKSVQGALVVFRGVWNSKCHPNNSTSTVARGWSNLGATAHSATLHGASATRSSTPLPSRFARWILKVL